MTESQQPQTTSSTRKKEARSQYLSRMREVTRSWLRENRVTPTREILTDPEQVNNKRQKVAIRCSCGSVYHTRVQDLKAGGGVTCPACSARRRVENYAARCRDPESPHYQRLVRASLKAAGSVRSTPYSPEERTVAAAGRAARARCRNPNAVGYEHYGGRGIEFRFASIPEFVDYIMAALGPKPGPGRTWSLDRIDPNGHYERGNLRWATYAQQNANKRAYRRSKNGERVRRLASIVPLSEQRLYQLVAEGLTDEQIIARGRRPGGRKAKSAGV